MKTLGHLAKVADDSGMGQGRVLGSEGAREQGDTWGVHPAPPKVLDYSIFSHPLVLQRKNE